MNKLNLFKGLSLISTLMFCSMTYADTARPSDADIVSSIKTQFAADKTTSDLSVNVSSKSGVVTLAGKINTDAEADELIKLAEATQGVKDVKSSQLMVKQSDHEMSDVAITAKVKGIYMKEKLFGENDIAVTGVSVDTTNGVVYLTGTVDNESQIHNAIKLAKSIHGVKKVESKLTVKATV